MLNANTPINKTLNIFFRLAAVLFIFFTPSVFATTYTLTSGQYPPCDTSWSVSGTTYTCLANGRVTLANGDILAASTSITISANNGFVLSNNTVGSASATINLVSNSGDIQSGNTNTVYGNITSTSGNITLINTTVSGAINTGGIVYLSGGSVSGLVTSSSHNIITNNTNLSGGATANSGISITGGTLTGTFSMSATNPATFSGVTFVSGNVSASTVSFSGGIIGTSSNYISVTSTTGAISISSATAYGNFTAPSYSTVNVSGSTVTGSCMPNSTPANACIAVCTTGFVSGMTGSYYNNKTLTSPVTGTRVDNSVNFDWGTGSPGVTGIGVDNFSVSWAGSLRAPATGTYTFQTISDDGVRLYVNNVLVINNWTDHSSTTDTSNGISLTAGQSYPIKLEYYENGGSAVVKLNWATPTNAAFVPIGTQSVSNPNTSSFCTVSSQGCAAGGLLGGALGKYYNNMTLTSPVTGTRVDQSISFDWGTGAPGVTGIGADNFSIHWDGNLKVNATGTYQFQTVSDDGVRLWVNGQQIINNWTGHSATTDTSTNITLTAGTTYPVVLEYFEAGGTAVIQLNWKKPSDTAFAGLDTCPSVVSSYGFSPTSNTGVTCAAEPIIITAYDNLGNAAAPTIGTQITLSTSPNTGTWVGGNTYTFTGTETSIQKYLSQTTPTVLNLNVTDGTNTESAARDSNITFANAALLVSPIPTQVAAVPGNVTIQAVRTDTNTGACVARATGSQTLRLGYVCRNPATCSGQTFTANSSAMSSNSNSSSAPSNYATIPVTFDSTGTTTFPINYVDVGKVALYAQLALGASGNDPAITLSGNSNDFVVKPYTLAVSSVQTSSSGANPGGTSASGTAAGFVPAGTPFKIYVEAQNALGNRTPSFGMESPTENDIKVVATTLDYPSGGTLTALSSAASGSFSAVSPVGTFVNTTAYWDQVGSIKLQAQLTDSDYLGGGNVSTLTTSGTVGRFYPDHYVVSASPAPVATNGCGASFSYMGQQTISLSYTLQALSKLNTVLTNYGSSYASTATIAAPAYVAENADGANGGTLSSRFSGGSNTASWINGVFTFSSTTATFARQPTLFAPDGPYSTLQLGLKVVDLFDGRVLQAFDMNETTTGDCTAANNCISAKLGSTLDLRYGRLRLDDAFGPGTVDLPVNFVTEYWNGNRFTLSANDSCTKVPRSAVTYPSGTLSTDSNRTVSLTGGSTQGSYSNLDATYINFAAGAAGQKFTAPGSAAQGSFVVGVDLTTLPWLQYDWDQNGNYTSNDTKLPNARYSFGSYRGNDRVIYWREKLQ